jgi:ribonuclease J
MPESVMMNSSPDVVLPLRVIPLGGLGEIGLNMMVVEYGDAILIVDAGLMFPEDNMLGIDIVIPDFSYLRQNRERLRALVVTHGHEDHIGAIPFLLRDCNVPIYATALTLALIREKLREHGLLESAQLIEVSPRQPVSLPPFQVEFIQVCHSIPDGAGLAIQTPAGTLVHSGDFKVDHTPVDGRRLDLGRFAAYGESGVLAFFSDSTNAERDGATLSEKDIGATLRQIFQECAGRIIIAAFASNLHRIQQVIWLARDFNRKVLLNGKSMLTNVRIARELGYLDFDPEMEINLQDLTKFPDHEVVFLTTGSQGEPMSALTRMALRDHKKLKIHPGDTVILSSKFIPGNERNIQNIINHLYRQGAEVIYEKVREIHVSGHAYKEELKLLINTVRPRYFIPIHGEFRHLVKHRQLALDTGLHPEQCPLVENGHVLEFKGDGAQLAGRVETGRVLVDGKGVGDVGNVVLRDRRHLSEDGLVIASLVIDKDTKEILSGPDIFSRGFIHEETKPEILEEARSIVLETYDRGQLKRFFQRILERRPVIYPIIIDV